MVVEFVIMTVVLGLVGVFGLTGVATYKADPVGWNATIKRLSRIGRANLEAGKAPKAVETKNVRDQLVQDWENQFHGKPKEIAPVKPVIFEHRIVETWYAVYAGDERPWWMCSCGYKNWHVDKYMANLRSREHVKNSNAAERAKSSGSKLQW